LAVNGAVGGLGLGLGLGLGWSLGKVKLNNMVAKLRHTYNEIGCGTENKVGDLAEQLRAVDVYCFLEER